MNINEITSTVELIEWLRTLDQNQIVDEGKNLTAAQIISEIESDMAECEEDVEEIAVRIVPTNSLG